MSKNVKNHDGGDNAVSLMFSSSLLTRIKAQAAEEGISIEDYLTELVSEGVVLRAWEIAERKAQMRQPTDNLSRGAGGRGGGGRQSRGRRGHKNYNAIMGDGANFLEYVREQERQQGR